MPFVSVQEVIRAATESTEKYLDFLKKSDRGIEEYQVNELIEIPQLLLIEGKTQYQYFCRLPPHLSIRSDSSALYVPRENPAKRIPIHIVSYERRSGKTKLASQEKINNKGGNIFIDFRWLVKRCLEWFEKRGSKVANLEDLVGRKIKWKTAEGLIRECNDSLSSEQWAAIKSILCNDLSYVWGPPGTGKTKYVLAKVVYAMTNQRQKSLVLASTNLAVDNALASVLEDKKLPRDKVARLGIPSKDFLEMYPECCEQRAFEYEIRDLNKKIQNLTDERKAVEEMKKLTSNLKRNTTQLRVCEEAFPEKQDLFKNISHIVETHARRVQTLEAELEAARNTLSEMQQERDGLRIPELNREIESNESLSTSARQALSGYRNQLEKLSFFSKILTNKAKKLSAMIAETQEELLQIETTLQSVRQRRDERLGCFEELNAAIHQEDQKIKEIERDFYTAREELDNQRSAFVVSQRDFLACEKQIQSLSEAIDKASTRQEELSQQFTSVDKTSLDEGKAFIEKQIQKLEEEKKKFELDLSKKFVIGITLDGFIGFSMNSSLTVDRVFVDEAPYAPVAKILPLLSLKRPIALLGDDKQLPPICKNKDDFVIRSYWAKGSHFLEDIFRHGNDFKEIYEHSEPQLKLTDKKTLTISYRFGEQLARILDTHVYDIGLQGWGDMDTNVAICDCEPFYVPNTERRQNYSEVNKIVFCVREFIEKYPNKEKRPSATVLTPYKNQAKLIWHKLRDEGLLDAVEVLNTHKAQGREWDWVFFSVSDTPRLPGVHEPFWTNSNYLESKLVLNTTISRAREYLILLLDKTYWSQWGPGLVGDMARNASVYDERE